MQVGVLGGTFDPIHLGHLIIAEEARERLKLEQVIFVPAGQPWLKAEQPLAPARHRVRMVELAVASNPCFQVASNEVERAGPSYTVDTLEELQQKLGADATLHFIMGMDALEQFHRWKEPERLLELCQLVVVNRPGHQAVDVGNVTPRYPQASGRVTLLSAPRIEISSTDIRRRAAQGISFRYQTPEAVERYILEHRLYQQVTKDE
jgi:nicotinate-nucleotide adenylyltransferase